MTSPGGGNIEGRHANGIVLVVDDREDRRSSLKTSLEGEAQIIHTILTAKNTEDALAVAKDLAVEEVAVIAVDLNLGACESIDTAVDLIQKLRKQFPKTRILAYTLLHLGNVEHAIRAAGASRYVHLDDVARVTAQIILEKELHELQSKNPLVDSVLNRINMSISIHDADYNVLWANRRIEEAIERPVVEGEKCWVCYHELGCRTCPCAECTAEEVISEAEARIAQGERSPDVKRKGVELLPVQGKIVPIEVDTAPIFSSDGKSVLAVVEAVRFAGNEWKDPRSAFDRFKKVVATARKMGKQSDDAKEFLSIAVYYRTKDTKNYYLFHFDGDADSVRPPKVCRPEHMPPAYGPCIQTGEPLFLPAVPPSTEPWHFLWTSTIGGNNDTHVFVDVAYTDAKQRELFLHDLVPYWQYIAENFESARSSRDADVADRGEALIEEFLGKAVDREEYGEDTDDLIIDLAIRAVRKTLAPFSMYLRTLDRRSNVLRKRAGFGSYFNMAREERVLGIDDTGSTRAVMHRKGIWKREPSAKDMAGRLRKKLAKRQLSRLERISGYITLPLVATGRVLGTLCVQFDDDSLLSEGKRQFLMKMARAITSALGRLAWMRERQQLAAHFHAIDEAIFGGGDTTSLEDKESRAICSATERIFGLTYADIVLYFRHERQSSHLRPFTPALKGTIPANVGIPAVLSTDRGIIGHAVRNKELQFIPNYRDPEYREFRQELLDAAKGEEQRRAIEWIGGTIVAPVTVGDNVEGVLVALSPTPNWLTTEDRDIVSEFASKTGLCLEAARVKWQLNHDLEATNSFTKIQTEMARCNDPDVLKRLFLLAVTAGECLGFSRAVLFFRDPSDPLVFRASLAVGHTCRNNSEECWRRLARDKVPLESMITACIEGTSPSGEGYLQNEVSHLVIDLKNEEYLSPCFSKAAIRRQSDAHVVTNTDLLQTLNPEGEGDIEYVLAPLFTGTELTSIVFADRAFSESPVIPEEDLRLLAVIGKEFAVISESLGQRRSAEAARTAERLAFGVSYALRTRAAALEAHLNRLKKAIGGTKELIPVMEGIARAANFFDRAGTLAAKHVRAGRVELPTGEVFDLNEAVREAVDDLLSASVDLRPAERTINVRADRIELGNAFRELLLNARDAIRDVANGRVDVSVSIEGEHARVDILDNGTGIHPKMKGRLFQMFECYPANRLGLGLSYAKQIVEAYGGTIEEAGEYGRCAHFVVQLPIQQENTA